MKTMRLNKNSPSVIFFSNIAPFQADNYNLARYYVSRNVLFSYDQRIELNDSDSKINKIIPLHLRFN